MPQSHAFNKHEPLGPQAEEVLWQLQSLSGPIIYMLTLVSYTGYPQASIRRAIQELRAHGYNISLENGEARLWN